MKITYALVCASALIISSTAFSQENMQNHNHGDSERDVIYHVNPMPNFMKIIMKHGEKLDLTEAQQKAFKAWRETNNPVMKEMKKDTVAAETKLREMALGGASEDELKTQYEQIEAIRLKIASTKIACRANAAKVLSESQFKKLQSLYSENLLAMH